jgi:uncharacterized membrane protein (UPF0127 family)
VSRKGLDAALIARENKERTFIRLHLRSVNLHGAIAHYLKPRPHQFIVALLIGSQIAVVFCAKVRVTEAEEVKPLSDSKSDRLDDRFEVGEVRAGRKEEAGKMTTLYAGQQYITVVSLAESERTTVRHRSP